MFRRSVEPKRATTDPTDATVRRAALTDPDVRTSGFDRPDGRDGHRCVSHGRLGSRRGRIRTACIDYAPSGRTRRHFAATRAVHLRLALDNVDGEVLLASDRRRIVDHRVSRERNMAARRP